MPKSKHYPPSYIRYQIEHPPVTVHLNRKLKETLDAFKGSKSYSQAILELIEGKLNVEEGIKRAPVTDLIIKYTNGFAEAMDRYGIVGKCKKCGKEYRYLWKDGKCDTCHGYPLEEPKLNKFKEKAIVDQEDFDKIGKVSILDPEKVAYKAGKEAGEEDGWGEGYEKAMEEFQITYPCSVCGKPMTMYSGDPDHKEMIKYMKEKGWHHGSCSR